MFKTTHFGNASLDWIDSFQSKSSLRNISSRNFISKFHRYICYVGHLCIPTLLMI
ncbi:hypothetical protein BU24DRAFT_96958 [Aaosphaeria arxii CBS 175.79]|uniref:Uncharacterized protein n=1 Tax=Aaosphaeria arxii CBS 175.79 TaxID=1450172 RepID=A0A6A5X6N6_9PLEO|nr:uncharacterized protein BU24DRAFT_96958 [Aaosphaeria arxii CBS 175.79]KAF2008444.1 hypothetical protein BU24DRAFT_96958 [Aaosphaeria arxii CBS 175.79]